MLGSDGPFTRQVLTALGADGIAPVAVLAPPGAGPSSHHSPIPLVHGGGLAERAAAEGVAVHRIGDVNAPDSLTLLRALDLDVLVIACHPRRLRAAALSVAPTLNIHPSPLPRYRGISPVFWQLRTGEAAFGVTVHRASEVLDAGPVLARQTIAVRAGERASAIESRLAEVGGRLAARLLRDPAALPRGRAQDERAASAQPAPGPDDFEIGRDWTAERAYRFIEGTREWGIAHRVVVAGRPVSLRRAVAFSDGDLGQPVRRTSRGTILIAFADGVLEAVEDP